ncbi:MAG: hypothetical protein DME27_07935 [Verrucomicrobia bacterium]|nr:MAG: hypothetical protein DME27_07935 [Verrucomicrobiota bacterium]
MMAKSGSLPIGFVPAKQFRTRHAMMRRSHRVCVTRAEEGAALWDRGELTTAPAPHVEVKDTVGAGDAFMAGLMVGLTRGMDHRRVLENACRLGAYVASHYGATPLLPSELTQPLRPSDS